MHLQKQASIPTSLHPNMVGTVRVGKFSFLPCFTTLTLYTQIERYSSNFVNIRLTAQEREDSENSINGHSLNCRVMCLLLLKERRIISRFYFELSIFP